MEVLIAHTESDLDTVASSLLEKAREHVSLRKRATLLLLEGELGAGKTALTKAIGRALGVVETITSPTFVIMKSYPIENDEHFDTLVHIDAYRIEDTDELRVLHFEELLHDTKNYIVIEWPERIESILPSDAPYMQLEIGKDNERIFTYGK